MNLQDLIVCWKRSGWEWDLHRYPRLDVAGLEGFYRAQNRDPQRMRASHDRQNANLSRIQDAIGNPAVFVSRNDLTRERLKSSKVFAVGGGDNHFTWASHYCPENVPMLLVNSDQSQKPNVGSDGGMLNFSTEEFIQMLPKLEADDFQIENWTLLEVVLDGKVVGQATSELFIGEKERTNCSRNWIKIGNYDEQHVGSGDVFATPAGVSGWYRSSTQNDLRIRAFDNFLEMLKVESNLPASQELLEQVLEQWNQSSSYRLPSKEERALFLANTERFTGGGRNYELVAERFAAGEEIHVTSLNDSEGIIRIDADESLTISFPPGAEAIVRVAKQTLKIVANPFR